MPVFERFLAVLALFALGVTVATAVMLMRRQVPVVLREQVALPLAVAVTVVATVGSLSMSEIAGYVPCALCWYQRIAMYPLVVVLGVAALRGDREVWRTSVPIAGIGAAIAAWHVAVEYRPSLGGDVCDPVAPCSLKWVEEFGFLTLPTMALIAFLAVIVLSLAARRGA